jgi:hypothetical protein
MDRDCYSTLIIIRVEHSKEQPACASVGVELKVQPGDIERMCGKKR